MTSPTPREPDAVPLDYARPRPVFNKRHFWAGFSGAVFTSIMCFVMLLVVTAYYYEDTGQSRLWAWLAQGAALAALGVLVYAAVRTKRRTGSRGALAGVLLGIGLCALPLGLCFAIVG